MPNCCPPDADDRRARRPSSASTGTSGSTSSPPRGSRWCSSATTRPTPSSCSEPPQNRTPYTKDGINNRVVRGDTAAVNPAMTGTKVAFWYDLRRGRRRGRPSPCGCGCRRRHRTSTRSARASTWSWTTAGARPTSSTTTSSPPTCPTRTGTSPAAPTPACCGASSCTATTSTSGCQGDPAPPPPSPDRRTPGARNTAWTHLALADVISMPDEWEYPWFAAWDLAFHTVPLAHVDPEFAKEQLVLMCREWAMHPNGQLPAYEWEFGDVNPPVHAWAAWHVYRIDGIPRPRLPHPRVHQAAAQLLLVGQPQGLRRAPTCSRAASSGWTTSACSTARHRCRPDTGWSSPTRRAGWPSTAIQMFKIALELSRLRPGLGRHRHQVPRALPLHRRGHEHVRLAGTPACGTTTTGSSTTSSSAPTVWRSPLRVRSLVGLVPMLAATEMPRSLADENPDVDRPLRCGCSGADPTWCAR